MCVGSVAHLLQGPQLGGEAVEVEGLPQGAAGLLRVGRREVHNCSACSAGGHSTTHTMRCIGSAALWIAWIFRRTARVLVLQGTKGRLEKTARDRRTPECLQGKA